MLGGVVDRAAEGIQAEDAGRVDNVALGLADHVGRKARTPWITPHRLTPNTHSQAKSEPGIGLGGNAGVVAQDIGRPRSARRHTTPAPGPTASSLTSVGTASTSTPRAETLAATSSRRRLLDVRHDHIQARNGRTAWPLPVPVRRPAPVTTATFSLVSCICRSFSCPADVSPFGWPVEEVMNDRISPARGKRHE